MFDETSIFKIWFPKVNNQIRAIVEYTKLFRHHVHAQLYHYCQIQFAEECCLSESSLCQLRMEEQETSQILKYFILIHLYIKNMKQMISHFLGNWHPMLKYFIPSACGLQFFRKYNINQLV